MERQMIYDLFLLSTICSCLDVAFGSKSPKVFFFEPKSGPLFGGTLLKFTGQHLNSSNITSIRVAGHQCVIDSMGSNDLQCLTSKKVGDPICGNVTIHYNSSHQTVENSTFCYKDNPEIISINPQKSFISGGINMIVSVSNLDVSTSAQLVFIYKNQSFYGHCSSNTSPCVTFKAPNLFPIPEQDFLNLSVTSEVNIEKDNRRLISSEKPKMVDIYRDPIFEIISSENEVLSEKNPTLVLKGQYIPNYVDKQEIKVTFGGIACPVVEVSNSQVKCNACEVIKQLHSTNCHEHTTFLPTTPEIVTNSNRVNVVTNEIPASSSNATVATTTHHNLSTPKPQNQTIKCSVTVDIGNFKRVLGSVTVSLDGKDSSNKNKILIPAVGAGAGLVILILIMLTVTLIIKVKRRKSLKDQPVSLIMLAETQSASREASSPTLKQILESVIEADARDEMDRMIYTSDKLTVGKCIGSGNFGCVYEGFLEIESETQETPRKVAIKTLQDQMAFSLDLLGFVQEAVFMKDFRHPNVLGLVGLAEKEPGVPYVILPFMEKGDLLTYVRDTAVTLTLYDVLKFGADISNGMNYLNSLKFVHRDLAARNCMLDSNLCVKVADFGLCRDIYEKGYYTSDNKKKLPIRWMALESIENGAYSTKSDVWSLGVVLWEMLTRGLTPYPGVDGWDVVNFLRRRRLPPPYFCPEPLYNLMMLCWAKDPELRPAFNTIQKELLILLGKGPDQSPSFKAKFEKVPNLYVDMPAGDNKTLDNYKQRSESLETIDEMRESISSESALRKGSKSSERTLRKDSISSESGLRKDSILRDEIWNGIQRELSERLKNSKLKKNKKAESSSPNDSTTAERENEKYGAKSEKHGSSRLSTSTPIRGSKVVSDVTITIPESYSDRGISKSAMGVYVKLVGNYEPPRKFSSPFRRLTKGHVGRNSQKVAHDVEPRHSGQIMRTASLKEMDSPVASRDKAEDAQKVVPAAGGDTYFELEPRSQRLSSVSDDTSGSVRSSYTMRTSGSMGSVLDTTHPGSSFMNATGLSSGGDSYLSLAQLNGQQSRSLSQNNMSTSELTSF